MAHAVISEGSRPSNSGMGVSFPLYLTTCSDMVAIASQPQRGVCTRLTSERAAGATGVARYGEQARALTGRDAIARETSRRSAPATRNILQKERMR